MSLEFTIRLTEILIAIALIQQSIEHLYLSKKDRLLYLSRIIFCSLLLLGFWSKWLCLIILIQGIQLLKRFAGPYNGGSDRMGLLILSCLCLSHFVPTLQIYIFGYLALQLIASYFIAGLVKISNKEWRSGQALQDLFAFSYYPSSESLQGLVNHPKILWIMSWFIIIFELLFPSVLFNEGLLITGLMCAAGFHLANLYLFGLNRFFWVWLAAYPSIIWLQHHIISFES